ncbi:unnamed protein product, partial [Ectocarpus sp. 12 AP-2014]
QPQYHPRSPRTEPVPFPTPPPATSTYKNTSEGITSSFILSFCIPEYRQFNKQNHGQLETGQVRRNQQGTRAHREESRQGKPNDQLLFFCCSQPRRPAA